MSDNERPPTVDHNWMVGMTSDGNARAIAMALVDISRQLDRLIELAEKEDDRE